MNGTLIDFKESLGKSTLHLPTGIRSESNSSITSHIDFPNQRDEAWKYTRLQRIASLQLKPLIYAPIPTEATKEFQIEFKDNEWSASKFKEGITVIASCQLSEKEWLSCNNNGHVQHLNVLSAKGGVSITIPPNLHLENVIQIRHELNEDNGAMLLRHQITVGRNSSVKISIISSGLAKNAYKNIVLDLFLEPGAQLHVDKLQMSPSNYEFYTERIHQERDSRFALQSVMVNPHFVRNDVEVYSNGEGTHTQLLGSFSGSHNNHIDNHTIIHHKHPNCTSDENYKGVLRDKATGVFNGKVKVYAAAQKTHAFQSNKNILLSELASMNSKPELEIYADDVKCSHGSTTGQMDDQALFFLRARGIGKEKATAILINAFLAEINSQVLCPAIQEILSKDSE